MPASALPTPRVAAVPSPAPAPAVGRSAWLGALLLVLAVLLAYANSLHGPFVYDDKPSIVYNGSIRHLWPVSHVLLPPGGGATVSGRPVLNLSFALNFALGGTDVRGYHIANILIHALAALALFGLVSRTLRLPWAERCGRDRAVLIAGVVAAIWALHPLQTEAVTYVVQRAESLMSLFYLLTLYGFVRSVSVSRPLGWQIASWSACLLGMATKENMVSAPVLVLLFDRAFVAGTLREAWTRRRGYYLALAATWAVLALLVATTGGNRGGSAGFDVGVGPVSYWLTQFPALVRYAALSLWPHPLVFDYGAFYESSVLNVAGSAVVVTGFLLAGGYALWRHPRLGFLAGLALAVLAPTSLIPGTTQMIVEHRMYLPLAAVVALLVPLGLRLPTRIWLLGGLAVAGALGVTTAARNRVYRTELSLWRDTVVKSPDNAAALSNYGAALSDVGRREEAMALHRRALKLRPDYVPLLANLGIALAESGKPDEALPLLTRAIRLDPNHAQAHLNLGVTLDLLHRPVDAFPHYELAVQINPLLAAAQNDYGAALTRLHRTDEALAHLHKALALDPTYPEAYFNLAAALAEAGRLPEAQAVFARGITLRPNDPTAHLTWANFLMQRQHVAEAFAEYATALQQTPNAAEVHYAYAAALVSTNRLEDAVQEYETAIRLRPDYAEAHNNLGNTLLELNRVVEAIPHYAASLRLRPANPTAENNLGLALARHGQLREAVTHFEAAVRLAPDFANARENLRHARLQLLENPLLP